MKFSCSPLVGTSGRGRNCMLCNGYRLPDKCRHISFEQSVKRNRYDYTHTFMFLLCSDCEKNVHNIRCIGFTLDGWVGSDLP